MGDGEPFPTGCRVCRPDRENWEGTVTGRLTVDGSGEPIREPIYTVEWDHFASKYASASRPIELAVHAEDMERIDEAPSKAPERGTTGYAIDY